MSQVKGCLAGDCTLHTMTGGGGDGRKETGRREAGGMSVAISRTEQNKEGGRKEWEADTSHLDLPSLP